MTRFENPSRHKHKRCAQCRGTDSVLRTLAHLLAAHSHATPKQAKEPTFPTRQKEVLKADDRTTSNLNPQGK